MLIDKVHILLQAGDGGKGCESFYTRPDRKRLQTGGNGGDGGSVIIRASLQAPAIGSLRFKQHVIAPSGEHGKSNRCRGKNGEPLIILVPPGSRIFDREKNLLIRELIKDGEEVVVVPGGAGGDGNYGGKTATEGEPGGVLDVEIHVRIQADIFLVGLPNSGKSSLLNQFTRANAKQGDYPFATRDPIMGVWSYSSFEQSTFCEIPSLYAHSHEGRGVGTKFVKHLEFAKFILYVLDPVSQFADSLEQGYQVLRDQIKRVSEDFLKIPAAIIVNKYDLEESKMKIKEEKFSAQFPIFELSATTGEGIPKLKSFLMKQLEEMEVA